MSSGQQLGNRATVSEREGYAASRHDGTNVNALSKSVEVCSSIWFPGLVLRVNGCLVPEAALPHLNRIAASGSSALLKNTLDHRLFIPTGNDYTLCQFNLWALCGSHNHDSSCAS